MHPSSSSILISLRNILGRFKLNIARAPFPGVSIFGLVVYRDARPGPIKPRSQYALEEVLKLEHGTLLDVGSGGGSHAFNFSRNGFDVECVDYGTSVYAKKRLKNGISIHEVDFMNFKPTKKYDIVWASHVLEHQRNVGLFIDKLIDCTSEHGTIVITVPDQHRRMLGGHLTHWSPGLLVYNCVLAQNDMRKSKIIRGSNEWTIVFKRKKITLPYNLTYDFDDINKLKEFLPAEIFEQVDLFYIWK